MTASCASSARTVGRGFTLMSPAGDPANALPPDAAAWFASIGGIGAHVAPGAPIDDLRGAYGRWFQGAGVELVLQRPDFHVFGTASTIDGAGGLVGRLRAALEAR